MTERSLTVVIPAKDEARFIERTLEALAAQTTESGAMLDPATFGVLVFCNDCVDGTAGVVRRFALRHPEMCVRVVEAQLPAGAAHVGRARRLALDLAADAHLAAGRPRGVLASTDADTIVSPAWVESITREIADVDAVAGFVRIGDADRAAMLAPLRLLYDRELMYRRLIGFVEARFDPRPYESSPRHASFVGANFAVTAAAYRRAGGLPPLPRLEDQAFARALEFIDARVKHSYDVRAVTSARFTARVEGGFASLLSELRGIGETRSRYFVRAGRAIVDEARARAAARASWTSRRTPGRRAFGEFWNAAGRDALRNPFAEEPIEDAILALRVALGERNASVPVAQAAAGERVS